MRLDERFPHYLYEQVILNIKNDIDQNLLKVGEKLPSEWELCQKYGTSRITVRRAIKELIEEGILEVRRGIGTFVVKESQSRIHLIDFQGFTDGLRINQDYISKKILSKKIIQADEFFIKIFDRSETFELVELIRLIKDDHGIFSVDYSYFPLDVYPGIMDKLQDDVSTFKIIRNEYDVAFYSASKEIDLEFPSEELLGYFEHLVIGPFYKIKKIIRDRAERPVHYSEYYLIPNKVKLQVNTYFPSS